MTPAQIDALVAEASSDSPEQKAVQPGSPQDLILLASMRAS